MNIPAGTLIISAKKTNWENFIRDLLSFYDKGFNGYFVITGMTDISLEEGIFVFYNGEITCAVYEILTNNHEVLGKYAVPLVFNLAAIDKGIYEVYELKIPQVQLIMSQNPEAVLKPPLSKKDIQSQPKHNPYNPEYVKKVLKFVKPDYLKRLKFISEMGVGEFKLEEMDIDKYFKKLGDRK